MHVLVRLLVCTCVTLSLGVHMRGVLSVCTHTYACWEPPSLTRVRLCSRKPSARDCNNSSLVKSHNTVLHILLVQLLLCCAHACHSFETRRLSQKKSCSSASPINGASYIKISIESMWAHTMTMQKPLGHLLGVTFCHCSSEHLSTVRVQ